MFAETRKLVQLVLMFPITSNEGEKIFSLMKRILHYTKYTMTEGRLNDLALMVYLHPIQGSLSSLLRKSLKYLCKQILENGSIIELLNVKME